MRKRRPIHPLAAAATALLDICDDAPPGARGDCTVVPAICTACGKSWNLWAHENAQFTETKAHRCLTRRPGQRRPAILRVFAERIGDTAIERDELKATYAKLFRSTR